MQYGTLASELRDILDYCPDTGVLTWRICVGRYGRIKAGTVAGGVNSANGYHVIKIPKAKWPVPTHRIAWAWMTGEWPEHEIDHINRVRSDNRWINLRKATLQENMLNKSKYKNNTSGCPGVRWHKHRGKWTACIGASRKRRHLGYFDDKQEAVDVYLAAKADLHAAVP
jgi:hypothetical protein